MPNRRKPPPRHLYKPEFADRLVRANFILRGGFLGSRLLRNNRGNQAALPEPDEELEGSELTDAERRQAIQRERTRRDGLS